MKRKKKPFSSNKRTIDNNDLINSGMIINDANKVLNEYNEAAIKYSEVLPKVIKRKSENIKKKINIVCDTSDKQTDNSMEDLMKCEARIVKINQLLSMTEGNYGRVKQPNDKKLIKIKRQNIKDMNVFNNNAIFDLNNAIDYGRGNIPLYNDGDEIQ